MRTHTNAVRRTLARSSLYAGALLVAVAVAPAARAQPADDPGLADPGLTPAPAPRPAPTPPPPAARPAPAPATRPAPRPAPPPTKARPVQPAAVSGGTAPDAIELKETVDTKTEWVASDDKGEGGDLYEQKVAPTLIGPVGLFRILTGDSGRSHSFRIGLRMQAFHASDFLIEGVGTGAARIPGDANTRFLGDLIIGYTPWKYIEAYLGIFNSSNRNERSDAGRTDPTVVLALGDFALGVKGRYPVAPFVDLGLHLGVKFLNGLTGIGPSGDSTNFAADLITSFDLRHAKATERVPLRFHINVGYLLDNSLNLLPSGQCAASVGNDVCVRSRVVSTFAYGLGVQRMRLGVGIDAPIAVKGVGIQPFVEYLAQIGLGDGDLTVARALAADLTIASDRISNRVQQFMTVGLRLRPVAGLLVDVGVDVGLQSSGFQYGPPLPPWNVIAGLGYSFEPAGRGKTKQVTKTITREVARGPSHGLIRGVVADARTRKPLGGVLIRYAGRPDNPQVTRDDGSFLSYGLPPGPITVEFSRDDYEATRADTRTAARAETTLTVMMTPRPPADGQVRVRVTDGAAPVQAMVRFVSQKGSIVDAEPQGDVYVAKLPPGDYSLEVEATNYLSRQQTVQVQAGQTASVEVVVHKRPGKSRVELKKDEIAIKGAVHFNTNTADILPDGEQLLDEVIDVMVKNPQLRRVRIEGHTDNRGAPQKNLDLSRRRAHAVMQYCIKQGIDPARLEAEGYGASQPIVPNLTPANRARNRRVVFRILEGGGQ